MFNAVDQIKMTYFLVLKLLDGKFRRSDESSRRSPFSN